MSQQIEAGLWAEFEAELNKVQAVKISVPSSVVINSKSLHEFFNKFLSEQFPTGELNRVIEKNLAVYIVKSQVDINAIIEKYKAMQWNYKPLLGWIKKVQSGQVITLNILELLKWANKNYLDIVPTLEKAKQELADSLPIESVPEIMEKPVEPINWIAEPFFRPKTISFMSSPAGKGKTWLALNVALCCSAGMAFLDKFNTRPTKVLYLDYENFDLMPSRLSMLISGLNKPVSDFSNLHILSTTSKFSNIWASLCKTIKENHYDFLIIDTLREFTEFDENDSSQVSIFINELRKLVQETEVCILLLHHEGKGHLQGEALNKMRGSTALSGAADCVLQLSSDNEHMTITHSKSRGAKQLEPFYCNILLDDSAKYKLTYAGFASELDSNKGIVFFQAWIKDNSITEFSSSEFWDACSMAGISKSTSRRTISKLNYGGKIRRESDSPRAKWQVFGAEPKEPEVIEVKPIKNKKTAKGVK